MVLQRGRWTNGQTDGGEFIGHFNTGAGLIKVSGHFLGYYQCFQSFHFYFYLPSLGVICAHCFALGIMALLDGKLSQMDRRTNGRSWNSLDPSTELGVR